ncbi:MAG: DUF3575 domain-containing protein [Flavobacterium sp.]|nr:MAG: DUF3575 domain-containing protein [Flavobacterium sp.]
MKKILLILLIVSGIFQLASAQEHGRNIVKINLLSLPLKNINLEYERGLTKKISVGIGFRYMSEGSIPFSNAIANMLNEDEDNWDERIRTAKLGNYAITPTVRFYMGEGNLKGFYIAPFARIAKYTAALNYAFEVDNGATTTSEEIPLSGSLNTFTGGILFGSQFNLAKNISLDWWIFGPQYGTSDGQISGRKQLSADEQSALRDQLGEIEDLPLVKATSTVDANGATVKFKGPWAGVRAGLSLGIRF